MMLVYNLYSIMQEPIIDIFNLPESIDKSIKDSIAHFLYKSIEKCHGLLKIGTPIIKSELKSVGDVPYIRIWLRSIEEALNCLDLNGIFYVPIFKVGDEITSHDELPRGKTNSSTAFRKG